jgi:hypothetical protein
MTAEEFILGRSGKWLSLGHFYKMPVPERRAEFVFGTAAEVINMMKDLPSQAELLRPASAKGPVVPPAADEMAAALPAGQGPSPGAPT